MTRVVAVIVTLLCAYAASVAETHFDGIALDARVTTISADRVRDRIPEYAVILLTMHGRGASPEENGAAHFWKAVWPGTLPKDHWPVLCKELGIRVPDASGFEPVDSHGTTESLKAWVGEPFIDDAGIIDPADKPKISEAAYDFLFESFSSPWTKDDIPPLAEWARWNEVQLDQIVDAAAKPKWYDPPPAWLEDPPNVTLSAVAYGAMAVRSATRSLLARAMLETGSGHYAAAWRDCRACLQLADHLGRSPSTASQLLALSIRDSAHRALIVLLSRPDLSSRTIDQIRKDLAALPAEQSTATSINTAERWSMLQLVLQARDLPTEDFKPHPFKLACKPDSEINLDAVLQRINSWQDRALDAAHQPTVRSRIDTVRMLRTAIEKQKPSEEEARDRMDALDGPVARGQLAGDILGAVGIGTSLVLIESADRIACSLEMVKLAAALAAWRTDYGDYPPSLDALTPRFVASLPADPYSRTGESFHYEKRGEGFVLYSVYLNGVDDAGTGASGWITKGEWVDKPADVGSNGDREDLVIRSPLPPFRRPTIKRPEEP